MEEQDIEQAPAQHRIATRMAANHLPTGKEGP